MKTRFLSPLAFGILFTICATYAMFRATPAERLATAILAEHLTTNRLNHETQRALQAVTKDTLFSSRVRINEPPREGWLNVYILASDRLDRSRLATDVRRFKRNCGYVGEHAIIICGSDFVDTFLLQHNVERGPSDRHGLLLWALGHEVGHVIHGHRAGQFHADSLDDVIATSTLDARDEFAADSFVAQQLDANTPNREAVHYLLRALLQQTIIEKVGNDFHPGVGLHYESRTVSKIPYDTSLAHPEYMLRTTRLLQLMASKDPRLSGEQAELAAFVRSLKR